MDRSTSIGCLTQTFSKFKFIIYLCFLQITDLLVNIGLADIAAKFKDNNITGKILLQCDDKILNDDLGVTSKHQRLLILQLITGKLSVNSLL